MRVVIASMQGFLPESWYLVDELSRRFDSVSVLLGEGLACPEWLRCGGVKGVELTRWSARAAKQQLERADALIRVPAEKPDGSAELDEVLSRLQSPPRTVIDVLSSEPRTTLPPLPTRASVRTCTARFGLVLRRVNPIARALCAARAQSAKDHAPSSLSWIHVLDAARALAHVVANENIRGTIDLVAPEAVETPRFVTSLWNAFGFPRAARGFAATLGPHVLSPCDLGGWPDPGARLVDTGFAYLFPDFSSALAEITS